MSACNSVQPLQDANELSTFTSDINLCAEAQSTLKRPAKWIRVEAVGASPSLVLRLGEGRSITRTFTPYVGWELCAEITHILDETADVTKVTVGW